MSLHRGQFRDLVGRVLLEWDLHSLEAVELLLGTAAQESDLGRYLRQVGGGPALGAFQVEPATHRLIWKWVRRNRPDLEERLRGARYSEGSAAALEWDLRYSILMARILYLSIPSPLPAVDDVAAQARYWKVHYNTIHGRGTVAEFIRAHAAHLE